MPTFRTIGGQEPSTISFSLDVVQLARNGSNVVREIQVIGDPDSTNGNAAVLAATPASTAWGLVTRPLFSSTGADNPVQISGNSTVVQGTTPWTIAGNSTVTFVATLLSSATPAANSTGLVVQQAGYVAPSTTVSVANTVTIQGNSTVVVSAFAAGLLSSGVPAATSSGLIVQQAGYVAPSTIVTVAAGNSSVIVTSGNSSVIITSGNSSVTLGVIAGAYLSSAAAAANSSALNVRIVGGASSAADFLTRPVFSSTNTDNPVRAVLSSTGTDNPVRPQLLASTGLSTLGAHGGNVNVTGDVYGRLFTRSGHQAPAPIQWSATASPGGSTFATVTKSSAAGVRQVVTGFTATVAARSTSPTAFHSTIALVDGAAGGSTFLWRTVVSLSTQASGMVSFNFANVWFAGALAGPVTLEFQSSGDANTIQSVTMWGQTLAE